MLDPGLVEAAREIFEINYYGVMHVSLAFAPVLKANGGGAIVNVLLDASWVAAPFLSAYAASKAAAWSFTNSLRIELHGQGTSVQGLHVGFIDTDLTHGSDVPKPAIRRRDPITGRGGSRPERSTRRQRYSRHKSQFVE